MHIPKPPARLSSRLLLLRHRQPQTFIVTRTYTSFKQTPSPPRLPKADQETFESLTKASMGAFSTSHLQSPPTSKSPNNNNTKEKEQELAKILTGEQKHKDLLTGGEKPLFEGEKNPVTGEVGGPKTEPTKYGDWSFNGRVTDF